jgi:hypothetical protein
MDCSDCIRLQDEVERRERAYAHAYGVLTSAAETTRASEYARLRGIVSQARIDLEVARMDVERHRSVHAI